MAGFITMYHKIKVHSLKMNRLLGVLVAIIAAIFVLAFIATKNAAASPDKSVTVTSKIAVAPERDFNHNGQIDGGDYARFSYILANSSDNKVTLAVLKTGIEHSKFSIIVNVKGATSLSADTKTVTIPNLNLYPHQTITISFDAKSNFSESDMDFSTEPKLFDNGNQLINQGAKQSAKINKAERSHIPSNVVEK